MRSIFNCLLTALYLSLSCFLSVIFGQSDSPTCKFGTHKASPTEMHKRLQPLLGKRYIAKDDAELYTYNIGICTNAVEEKTFGPNVGVVQTKNQQSSPTAGDNSKTAWIIGNFNDSQLIEGTDWLILEYNGGDNYTSHCGKERRRARIMITCDKSVKAGDEEIQIFEEQTDKSTDCYYLFEMGTSVVCAKQPIITVGLSVGSILVIVFIVVVILYGLLGFLYNRLVLGAKGKEQIPNYTFWQDFGNLQADGCDLVCRSGKKAESRQYKGLGDDQLQEEDDRDDNLLPM